MTVLQEAHTHALRYTLFFPSIPFYFKYVYYFKFSVENFIIYTIYTMYCDHIHPSLTSYNFPLWLPHRIAPNFMSFIYLLVTT